MNSNLISSAQENIDTNYSNQVVTSNVLTGQDLSDLFTGKIAAIRIPGFCDRNTIDHGLNKLHHKNVVEYNNAAGVGKYENLGMAYFEATNDELKKEYYSQSIASIQKTREIFSPYLAPIDKVRLEIGEKWPHGASLLNLGEGPMFVGLIRALSKEIFPHEDKLERDDPSIIDKIDYVGQAAFNCYLKVPSSGGELDLWNISLPDQIYDDLRGASYGISRDFLPAPTLSLKPKEGELIVFNPRYLHAVSKCSDEETRISASGFVLYQGEGKPLHLWS